MYTGQLLEPASLGPALLQDAREEMARPVIKSRRSRRGHVQQTRSCVRTA